VTSKFSRRSTRVQKPPVICKSTPPAKPSPRRLGTWSTLDYSYADGGRSSHFAGDVQLIWNDAAQLYRGHYIDEDGTTCTVTAINEPWTPDLIGELNLNWTGFPPPPPPPQLAFTQSPGDPGHRPWITDALAITDSALQQWGTAILSIVD